MWGKKRILRKFNISRFVEILRENPSFFKVWVGNSQGSISPRFGMIVKPDLFNQINH